MIGRWQLNESDCFDDADADDDADDDDDDDDDEVCWMYIIYSLFHHSEAHSWRWM